MGILWLAALGRSHVNGIPDVVVLVVLDGDEGDVVLQARMSLLAQPVGGGRAEIVEFGEPPKQVLAVTTRLRQRYTVLPLSQRQDLHCVMRPRIQQLGGEGQVREKWPPKFGQL